MNERKVVDTVKVWVQYLVCSFEVLKCLGGQRT